MASAFLVFVKKSHAMAGVQLIWTKKRRQPLLGRYKTKELGRDCSVQVERTILLKDFV